MILVAFLGQFPFAFLLLINCSMDIWDYFVFLMKKNARIVQRMVLCSNDFSDFSPFSDLR
jgi:hypothetical protein